MNLNDLRKALNESTAMVSVMWATNETGLIFPIEEIGQIVKERGILFHVDAIQAAGRIPINLKNLSSVDLLSVSAHKFHGPKGVGALFMRRGTKCRSLIIDGPQENMRRAGTDNGTSIIGMGRAAELASTLYLDEEINFVGNLRDRLEGGILKQLPGSRIKGAFAKRIPSTINFTFPACSATELLDMLAHYGIYATSGAACSAGLHPSHGLLAMGLTPAEARSSIRFGLSRCNSEGKIDYVISALRMAAKTWRAGNGSAAAQRR